MYVLTYLLVSLSIYSIINLLISSLYAKCVFSIIMGASVNECFINQSLWKVRICTMKVILFESSVTLKKYVNEYVHIYSYIYQSIYDTYNSHTNTHAQEHTQALAHTHTHKPTIAHNGAVSFRLLLTLFLLSSWTFTQHFNTRDVFTMHFQSFNIFLRILVTTSSEPTLPAWMSRYKSGRWSEQLKVGREETVVQSFSVYSLYIFSANEYNSYIFRSEAYFVFKYVH